MGGSDVRCLLVNTTSGATFNGACSGWEFPEAPGTIAGFDIDHDVIWRHIDRKYDSQGCRHRALHRDVVVGLGGGDSQCSLLGSGIITPEEAAISEDEQVKPLSIGLQVILGLQVSDLGCLAVGKEPTVLPQSAIDKFRAIGDMIA